MPIRWHHLWRTLAAPPRRTGGPRWGTKGLRTWRTKKPKQSAASIGALSHGCGRDRPCRSRRVGRVQPELSRRRSDAADGSTKPEHRWQSQAAADWRTPPEPVDDAKITDGGTFDVVVVGGGQAAPTARSAAMNGASVCVVEAQPEDSFFYIGGEVAIANSEWALERGADRIDKAEFMTGWLVQRQPQQPAPHPQLRGLLRPDHQSEHFGNQRSRSRLLQQHRSREPLLG